LADPVTDEEKAGGTVIQALRRIEEKLNAHNRVSIDITTAPTEIKKYDYPLQRSTNWCIMQSFTEFMKTPIPLSGFTGLMIVLK